jgi:hypothetical protein
MGDWDYINEHLGGHDSDGLPNLLNDSGFLVIIHITVVVIQILQLNQ